MLAAARLSAWRHPEVARRVCSTLSATSKWGEKMKAKHMMSCAVAAILSGSGGAALAADQTTQATNAGPGTQPTASNSVAVEQVVVTAQRRSQSVQKVPMTVQALTGTTLAKLNITSIDQILKITPNVTASFNGPGQGSIFMRGLSAGAAGDQSSATAGNFPNVALYLDDQSMQFPGRNVDVYAIDLERVEVLEGPQGTLFGGGAEAGAVRYITNKPEINYYGGSIEGSYGGTVGGADNSSIDATINIPLVTDKLAVRAVIYDDNRGGYIDNVPSTFTRKSTDPGIVSYFGGAVPSGIDQIDNSSVAGKNVNSTTYKGARFSALYDINEDWNALIEQSFQNLDAEGSSEENPYSVDGQPLKPLQTSYFNPEYDKDNFENTAWTLNGKLSGLNLLYTGAYMTRSITQQMDYTNYSRTAGGVYYECVGGSTGWKGSPTCYSPSAYWQDKVKNTHLTNELRLSTPADAPLRAIGGVYYEMFRIRDDMNFNYRTIPDCDASNLAAALAGGATCVADVATAPGSTATYPGVRSDTTGFGEDAQRGYDQFAAYVSGDYDIIPDVLTITAGTRFYHYTEFETGSQYGTDTACEDVANGCTADDKNINDAHDFKVYNGLRSSANISWHIQPNTMAYFTFSQGFRPGGFNRSVSAVADLIAGDKASAQYEKPNSYEPDSLDNFEIGVKTTQLDNRLLLNLSAYLMDWNHVQFLFYDPTQLGNTTFGVNGPGYEVKGLEGQFTGRVTPDFTVQGSFSWNDDTQSTSPCLTDNIGGTPSYGKCITQVNGVAFANPFGALGSTPAFSPKFQGNLRGTYTHMVGEYTTTTTVGVNYMGSEYNEPSTYESGVGVTVPNTTYLRYLIPSYATVDASFSVAKDRWTATLFGTNLTNSHASTFTTSGQFIEAEVPLRPLVYGLKLGTSF